MIFFAIGQDLTTTQYSHRTQPEPSQYLQTQGSSLLGSSTKRNSKTENDVEVLHAAFITLPVLMLCVVDDA